MRTNKPTLLLTGATGVAGRAFIDELYDTYDIVCLRHRTPVGDPRVREVRGDLTTPGLGLDAAAWRAVGDIDAVLHCAAVTDFRTSREGLFVANVDGTARVLDVVATTGARLYHVSTAFVWRDPAAADDDQGGPSPSGPLAYVDSKIAAERLVAGSGLPHVIVRPSVIIGDSKDGRMSSFQGIHKLAAAILRNSVPLLPSPPNVLIDYVPQDVVALAVRQLLDGGVTGGEYWLTAGEAATPLADLVAELLELGRELGISVVRPRMVSAGMVDRLLLPLLEDMITPRLRRQFLMQMDMLRLFQHDTPLPSSLPSLGFDLTRWSQLDAFRRSTEYLARKHELVPAAGVAG